MVQTTALAEGFEPDELPESEDDFESEEDFEPEEDFESDLSELDEEESEVDALLPSDCEVNDDDEDEERLSVR